MPILAWSDTVVTPNMQLLRILPRFEMYTKVPKERLVPVVVTITEENPIPRHQLVAPPCGLTQSSPGCSSSFVDSTDGSSNRYTIASLSPFRQDVVLWSVEQSTGNPNNIALRHTT